ncbi:MAG: transcription elongation factor GreA [Elusimicrobia bacterium]|nr:transcription elongation factor GreA [Elusimicrobiota bacterium]
MTEGYITRAGRDKLLKEIEELRERKKVLSFEIGEAREKGDISENAEYHSAKERLGEVLRRMANAQTKLANAKLIEEVKGAADTVAIGMKVTLQDKATNDEITYTLVGSEDSDPTEGKISVYSPMAQGLLGKKQGEEAEVTLPAGKRVFKILKTEPFL